MKRVTVPAAVAALALALTACGSGGGSGAGDGKADVAAAKTEIAPYLEAPADFPITTPLKTSPAGKHVSYLDCGTPVCGLTWTDISAAGDALGIELTRLKAGLQAESISAAFDTVLQTDTDGVLDPALPNPLAEQGLAKLKEAGIPVVGGGVINGSDDQFGGKMSTEVAMKQLGEIFAAYVVSVSGDSGPGPVVFYETPELELTAVIYDGFKAKYEELCDGCEIRTADIPVASLGTNAASLISDDLQAHPDTKLALFSLGEQTIGLPAALKTAGIDVDTMAAAPGPDTLQQIKNGDMLAAIGFDFVYLDWAMADMMARLLGDEPLDPTEEQDVIPMQVLTKDDITDGMLQTGWIAFPDIADRFGALWADAK